MYSLTTKTDTHFLVPNLDSFVFTVAVFVFVFLNTLTHVPPIYCSVLYVLTKSI
jgi:hypothetical protein